MKLIKVLSLIGVLLLLSVGCSNAKSSSSESETKTTSINKEIQILEVNANLKDQSKKRSNSISFLQEEAQGGFDSGSKKTFNIDLKKGQYLKINTQTEYPITIMLKDNSTGEYIYNKTQIPKDNSILLNGVDKDGNYELMLDFNEIEVFNFQVYIVNN
ncbi:MAG: hypothetical protein KIB53_00785 [Paraclostridium bifermentans]|uniref:hypothetical protein n=1 Tax=Paraclostridium bifermentans TaxID=1490 RepID=UPI0011DDA15C|nr:hypothetical protein [Paraclostridium bifermentans]MBS5952322.1 hypothetical protein [Paraclostridium bifermentans]MBU5287716.1 hypothetical protein [Paraclostridium bifermentans]MDU3335215.1 hypothetical protein [Paraclostridium bifermentans]